ncbi:MAG: ATP synthase F1 subunit gamma [Defluviitaleaceae bacterium]|nr:ATP synthase F1 subunit gamma [Defluviitaleaceae bacterium]
MSQSMNEIKSKMVSTQNMSKITKAMQMVSAAKLTKAENKVRQHDSYVKTLETTLKHVMATLPVEDHVLFNPSGHNPCTAYLVNTSDRGLAGGYNNNTLKLLQQQLNQATAYKIYMIGSKGFDYGKNRLKTTMENQYMFVPDEMIYTDIAPLVNQIITDYLNGEVDQVVMIYNNYVSKMVQEPEMEQILPLQPMTTDHKFNPDYYFSPNQEEILQQLLVKYLSGSIYHNVLKAKLSEHASRMNAMKSATDNAMEIIKESALIYNRARQAAITQEINEIVGGAAALKIKKKS